MLATSVLRACIDCSRPCPTEPGMPANGNTNGGWPCAHVADDGSPDLLDLPEDCPRCGNKYGCGCVAKYGDYGASGAH